MTTGTPTAAAPPDGGASASQVLQPLVFDLWGSRLIEASAGTGKTWTIAALYLRLVLGHGGEHGFVRPLQPAEILVMTFTRAATRELSDRIRERLLTAAQCFRGERSVDADDRFLGALLAAYGTPSARQQAAWLLAMAAQSMDDAAVHTIDAWCQRMLREHAFDSGSLFDEALVADEQALRVEAVQDYWRQQCYPLTREALTQVLGVWRGIDALTTDMQALLSQDIPAEAGQGTLAEVLTHAAQARSNALTQLKQGWAQRAQRMRDWLDGQTSGGKLQWDGRKLSPKNYGRWLDALLVWAERDDGNDQPDLGAGWQRLTPDGLWQARTAAAPPLVLPPEFAEFAALPAAIAQVPKIAVAVRLHAAVRVKQRLAQLKQASGTFGFADMLHRLHLALQGQSGERLRARLLAQYPAILIDEFQDTSPVQYQIFDRIYQTQANDRQSALLLIGDPKQSIYGFRGADIHSYLQARRATSGRHYVLETNFRSTAPLVSVVNHWFAQADMARQAGAFMYRRGADDPLPFVRVKAQGRRETLLNAQGSVPAMTLVHDLQLRTAAGMRQLFAAHCAEQIVTWLNDPQAGFQSMDGGDGAAETFAPLRPADIAVLVRTGKEAAAVRHELDRRGVASVYLSDKDSVFDSDEARDLVHWLRAVAMPQDLRLVRAALATRTIALSLDELARLAGDEQAFDDRCEQLRQLRTVWQLQGVLAMLRQTLHQLGLAARWLAMPGGERKLTNYLHLAELLQTASSTLDGEQALIRWLAGEMGQGGARNDEQVVRLESDADLVKVITIHKSKGLEYPVVCLPFAASFREKDKRLTRFVTLADEQGARQLLLDVSAPALVLADQDRLREDLRLLYVALTRARHALWLGFSALKTGNSPACITHKSAAGYLLGGTEPIEAADWLTPLVQLAAGCAELRLQPLAAEVACSQLVRSSADAMLPVRAAYSAQFERDWRIGSFSRLARDLSPTLVGSALSPLQVMRPADDEEEPANAATPVAAPAAASPLPWHSFARGAEAGNFLHDQLEWLAGEQFALAQREPLAARLRQHCRRAGRAAQAEAVVAWLSQVVQTVLPGPGVALSGLHQVLPEMEFWLPARALLSREIDALCCTHLLPGVARPSLAERELRGMLMGFADLVFEHGGRYWVLDYKSNHLGDQDAAYDAAALAQAMATHRYDVQGALYMLALHRLLKARLGSSYQPEQQLGGAVYLFLRGVQGPERGVCLLPPSLPLLQALDAMLDAAQVPE
jgi:exodeoxyribonuclease V beta subunit